MKYTLEQCVFLHDTYVKKDHINHEKEGFAVSHLVFEVSLNNSFLIGEDGVFN
jgi:hypothetical protein